MTRAEEARAARELFQRAVALDVTPAEVRRREAQDRWSASDRRLADKRAAVEGCGRELKWFQL